MMPAAVAAFPLETDETLLWWRETDDGGYLLRVRKASGGEWLHDIYPDEVQAAEAEHA
jgi:hypothetical protein